MIMIIIITIIIIIIKIIMIIIIFIHSLKVTIIPSSRLLCQNTFVL